MTTQQIVVYYKNNKALGGDQRVKRRNKLISLRKQRDWFQKDVVAELKNKYGYEITVSYYGMIEQGVRTPKLDLALAIASLFGRNVTEIFLKKNTTKRCVKITN